MKLIDTHAHLDFPQYETEVLETLDRARDAGLTRIIQIALGPEIEKYHKSYELVKQHPQLSMAVGFHPHDAKHFTPEHLELIREFSRYEKVVAVGEIGLDYYYEHSDREQQKEVLRTLLDAAIEVNKPVCIHTRDAAQDSIDVFSHTKVFEKVGGVIHCFSGTVDEVKHYLDLGAHISFSGIVTFAKAQSVQEACKLVPMDKLLIETDCPFLAPVPHRGKRNEPAYVRHVAEQVASIKGLSLEHVATQTTQNAHRLFRFSN
ncbi:MAG: TatD family hydrolase [Bdellovibrionota bacterium]